MPGVQRQDEAEVGVRGYNPRSAAGRARLVEHQRPSRFQQRVQAVQHLGEITDKRINKMYNKYLSSIDIHFWNRNNCSSKGGGK